ncbi:MAG: poly(A) polymerase, partial [Sphaerochaetaceae bacterium]|nr:poly(A) polymerase [Sphaerochaetaceae bacterium]
MRIRYKKDSDGLRPVARIYTKEEHRIDSSLIDQDAVRAISRLKQNGFSAYIVGGAVRDILLGRVPKDFDIATSASPRQVHKLFYQARVIGKRFKLVHLVYGQKIIEVSTFRGESNTDDNTNNVFGTIETDAKRRDFTINSLYYDPIDETLVDFNNSMEDFKHKRIHSVLPLSTTFTEDPVRMIRALKYSVTTGFKMDFALKLAIRRD